MSCADPNFSTFEAHWVELRAETLATVLSGGRLPGFAVATALLAPARGIERTLIPPPWLDICTLAWAHWPRRVSDSLARGVLG